MAEQPLDHSLKKIKFLYQLAGMTLDDRDKSWSELFRYLFNLSWHLTDIFLAIHWFIEGAYKGLDFTELTHVMPLLWLGLMAILKSVLFIRDEKKVHELINTLRNLEETRASNPNGRKMMADETKFLGVVIRVLILMNIILLVNFNLVPLVFIGATFYLTGGLKLMLPFLDMYPFDAFDLRYWPFAYVHQIWTSCIVLFEIFAVDFLFYICCTHIRVQFKLLQRELELLIPGRGKVEGFQIKEKLTDLIKWHQVIMSTAAQLEAIYTKSSLYNYLISSVIICLTGFNVTVFTDLTIVLTFACIFFVGMLQIFFLCFFGDMLMNSSMEVSLAAYSCHWYHADTSIGKTILMVQTRAQKPCKLTAAGFADVNLNAFMKILSTSWSYFALLQTIFRSHKN